MDIAFQCFYAKSKFKGDNNTMSLSEPHNMQIVDAWKIVFTSASTDIASSVHIVNMWQWNLYT